MATIKSFTDLEQSKELAKFLPLESADMKILPFNEREYRIVPINDISVCGMEDEIPAWSLAALLNVLPKKYYPIKDHETNLILGKPKDKWCVLYWDATGMQNGEQTLEDNPVDACVAMIEKLHELKML